MISGAKYAGDIIKYKAAQNVEAEEIELTSEEQEQVEAAKGMIERIENYEQYLNESVLMQLDPYAKPVIDLQYYVESDYTYNYTNSNNSGYLSPFSFLNQYFGETTILSSFLDKYCARQENVELEMIKCLHIYIILNFSHTASFPDSK